jgi:hypothetical protein
MKYRKLGCDGPVVSAIRARKPRAQREEMFAIGAGAGARYRANVLKGVGL